jgi:hypothetical protein
MGAPPSSISQKVDCEKIKIKKEAKHKPAFCDTRNGGLIRNGAFLFLAY